MTEIENSPETVYELFVTCPKGLEHLVDLELESFGCQTRKIQFAGVAVEATLDQMYHICLYSRVANRVLLKLNQGKVLSKDYLYELVKSIDWQQHMRTTSTFKITFNGQVQGINNSLYGMQLIKDAVCDYFRDLYGVRPNVAKSQPDLHINVHVHKDLANVYLDLSGDSLHRRGYKKDSGKAPLKENLAASLLLKAKWPELAKKGAALIDPTCGSGTFLTEAILMATDTAPGLYRTYWGFERWLQHDPVLWNNQLIDARKRRSIGEKTTCKFYGFDSDGGAISYTERNIASLNLNVNVTLNQQPLAKLVRTDDMPDVGLLIANPPYGERMSDKAHLTNLYQFIGQSIHQHFNDYNSAILTNDAQLGFALNMRLGHKFQCLNGKLECVFLQFQPDSFKADRVIGYNKTESDSPVVEKAIESSPVMTASYDDEVTTSVETTAVPKVESFEPTGPVVDFVNRVKKNQKRLKSWIKKNNLEAYRLYDADLPEYSVAIDIYQNKALVQEYRAPKTIDEQKAHSRMMDIIQVLPSTLGFAPEHIYYKERERQRGKSQYEKQQDSQACFHVNEYQAKLEVNLSDYLDSGLFLDHRPIRKWVFENSQGKSFLNLFCYTASVSVHAALGGATRTTSVDLSNTYTKWGQRNIAQNGLSDFQHRCVASDCFEFLKEDEKFYDLIFMDPPTFSNSKKLKDVMDIQRDHSDLIDLSMRRLNDGGTLIFSNNFKKFKLDDQLSQMYDVKEITKQTIDLDFARHNNIHRCWMIKAK
ncbi:bifunctional 23S rRNA (guanine(2069)-N(7))-methyltransferase RlmK/23S rRNA (guanine(2445)-N(2))-methyltransferase RlmL [Marinicellulosiphila megalodicopiae]|uniref:bifunctional 23S rRNA (guanine(2069)-N(7))-methyltransferase RlmK/23S rRNA (guanine(2445)-N(2))-methyltransferase RlmL n=1 Tax=Marinicellulosiphila megalodicopiae TaxID=2724896 RepID=UPI003BAF83C5